MAHRVAATLLLLSVWSCAVSRGSADGAASEVSIAEIRYRAVWPGIVPYSPEVARLFTSCVQRTYGLSKLLATVEVAEAESATVISAQSSSSSGRRLLAPAPAMAPAQGAAAYNGADITAHVSATPNSGPLALGGPAGSVQALLSSCTRSQGYEVTFITLSQTVARAGAATVAKSLLPSIAVRTELQVAGAAALPFTDAKQTALLVFLNSFLPSSLSALEVVSVTPAPAAGGANVILLAQTQDGLATFRTDLAAACGRPLRDQAAAAGLDGFTATLRSTQLAPGASLAGQVAAFGVALPPDAAADLQLGGAASDTSVEPSGGGGGSASGGLSTAAIACIAVAAAAAAIALVIAAAMWAKRGERRRQMAPPSLCDSDGGGAPCKSSQPSWTTEYSGCDSPRTSGSASEAGSAMYGPVRTSIVVSRSGASGGGGPSATTPSSGDATCSLKSYSGAYDVESMRNMNRMGRMDDSLLGWVIDPADIEICRRADGSQHVLGSGSYGKVYKAVRAGVQEVAVKMLFNADGPDGLKQFRDECCILKSLNYDRNVVQFYGACMLTGTPPMLLLEYCEGGDLRAALNRDEGGRLGWYNRGRRIALDIAAGLHFLHSHDVMHSDLKTKNILLTRNQQTAKIADVGLAQFMGSAYFKSENVAFTLTYAAPELLLNAICSSKVDIYSLGVVLWEIVTGELPSRGRLTRVNAPLDCPEAIAKLIDECLEVDPSKRPTAKQCFERMRAADDPPPPATESIRRASRAAAAARRAVAAVDSPPLHSTAEVDVVCAAAAARGSRPSFGSGGAADCFPPHSAAQPADQSAAGAARLASGGGLRLQQELFEDAQGSRPLEDAADRGDAACSAAWQTAVQYDAFESQSSIDGAHTPSLCGERPRHNPFGCFRPPAPASSTAPSTAACGTDSDCKDAAGAGQDGSGPLRQRFGVPGSGSSDGSVESGSRPQLQQQQPAGAAGGGKRFSTDSTVSVISTAEEAEAVLAQFATASAELGEVWMLPPPAGSAAAGADAGDRGRFDDAPWAAGPAMPAQQAPPGLALPFRSSIDDAENCGPPARAACPETPKRCSHDGRATAGPGSRSAGAGGASAGDWPAQQLPAAAPENLQTAVHTRSDPALAAMRTAHLRSLGMEAVQEVPLPQHSASPPPLLEAQ